jgi:hypothetical protein
MAASILIDERFCGPPGAGNGGYVCGRLAALACSSVAEVTLRRQIPLGQPLSVEIRADGVALLNDGEMIAEAKPQTSLDLSPPLRLGHEDAVRAMSRYIGFRRHGFPHCFVCGPARRPGDGLRIFPGRIDGYDDVVAAPWTPDPALADETGTVRPEFIWAALDCPGAFAPMGENARPMLLGRMTATVKATVRAGDRSVVLAWKISADGRKQVAGSAVLTQEGEIAGLAKAIWFDVPASGP